MPTFIRTAAKRSGYALTTPHSTLFTDQRASAPRPNLRKDYDHGYQGQLFPNAGLLSVTGDNVDDAITASRDAAGNILSTTAPYPSMATNRRSPTPH